MGLEVMGDLAMYTIMIKLDPKDTARVACVSKKLRVSALDESLWLKICSDDLHLSQPTCPLGNRLPSFKVCYQVWREAFVMYPWPLVKRVKRCWDRIKTWLAKNFPEAEATLRRGASEADINEMEKTLKVKLPTPTRLLYRFCDGQEFPKNERYSYKPDWSLGLIGGYSCYEHLVNVYLLTLNQVILQTKEVIRALGFARRSKYVLVASSTCIEKLFFLNCTNGQLYVGTRNLHTDGEMIPCVPNSLISSVHETPSDQQQDGLLLWLEEHGRRLESGIIKLHEEGNIRSINLFPEEPPFYSTSVTNGVKVCASTLFVPELANLHDDVEKYFFSYSIRMSLLPQGCIVNGRSFSSCQLHRRRWIIRANDVVVFEVNAEAVIGKYPLLRPGEKEFVYESCTPLQTSSGSMEGYFTFVPGRLADPRGSPFQASVARVLLQMPDYVF